MTKDQAIMIVESAIPSGHPTRNKLAQAFLGKSVLKIARVQGVEFTKRWEPFTLETAKPSYIIGKDILNKFPGMTAMQDLWRTDVSGWPIDILSVGKFSAESSGLTNTGPPRVATIHSNPPILEVYPIPDSDYPVRAKIRSKISAFEDVPSEYHDAVIDQALVFLKAMQDPGVLMRLTAENIHEIRADGPLTWTGDTVSFESLGHRSRALPPDRVNVVPE